MLQKVKTAPVSTERVVAAGPPTQDASRDVDSDSQVETSPRVSSDQVTAVELSAHVGGKLAVLQSGCGIGGVWRCRQKVAAQRKEYFYLAVVHGFNSWYGS